MAPRDAVQEALLEDSLQWPSAEVPDKPRGWLLRVASRRLIDAKRQDGSRLERERRVFARFRPDESSIAEAAVEAAATDCTPSGRR